MTIRIAGVAAVLSLVLMLAGTAPVRGGDDLSDGISEATDESIAGDDSMGSKDTNINFIVVDAIAKAKMMQYQDKKKSDMNNKTADAKNSNKRQDAYNYNDGKGDNNQNSIVFEAGSNPKGNVYNINLGR